ncbi:hypothetical protein [Flaviflexus ciconiae]|uniref:hypothetical protein n=1 Tax=Flaviflexus ciconiae TaxID=2496867 RepID=UPI0019D09070|nr:hypothetical protein [Flaviflexus ciconiae]
MLGFVGHINVVGHGRQFGGNRVQPNKSLGRGILARNLKLTGKYRQSLREPLIPVS